MPVSDTGQGTSRAFWATFALCAVAACVPLWAVKYLPMIDLPQHAAQVAIWQHLDDPAFGFAPYFEMHYTTPYLTVYALVRALAVALPLVAALKVAVTLAVLGLPLALVVFFRSKGVSPWWSLIGFPLAYGYSFLWGFLNFMFGVPIAFLYLALAAGYARAPTTRRGVGLACFTLSLFAVHGLFLVFCPPVAAITVVAAAGSVRTGWRRLWPLVAPLPLVVAWRLFDPPFASVPVSWELGVERLGALFALAGYRTQALAPAFVILAGAVILLRRPGAAGAGVRSELPPLVLSVLAVLLWPSVSFAGATHIATRFNVFWLPFLIAWLRPEPIRALRAGLACATVALAAVLLIDFRAFDREGRQYEALAEHIPARSRVRPLVFRNDEETPFLHFPVWTQAAKGGLAGFSFASNFTSFVRYRADAPALMKRDEEWRPDLFDWRREWPLGYDAFVVRSHRDRARELFAGAPVELVARNGPWWLYRPRR